MTVTAHDPEEWITTVKIVATCVFSIFFNHILANMGYILPGMGYRKFQIADDLYKVIFQGR